MTGRYLITGVSRGVGAEVARRLRAAGHQVYGIVRTADPVVVAELAGYGLVDLSEPTGIGARLADFATTLPALDGLLHSAGIARGGSLAQTTASDLGDQLSLNVTAVAEVDRVFLPALRAGAGGRGGTVVYLNSGSGLTGRHPLGGYAASKHALRGYADSLRLEEPGIRIGSIYPGRVDTDMQRELVAAEGADYDPARYLRVETVAQVILGMLTLPADGVITDLTLSIR